MNTEIVQFVKEMKLNTCHLLRITFHNYSLFSILAWSNENKHESASALSTTFSHFYIQIIKILINDTIENFVNIFTDILLSMSLLLFNM